MSIEAPHSPLMLLSPEIRFYQNRLQELLELKKHIDSGLYPMSAYEGIPIAQPEHIDLEGVVKGLRFGVLHCIANTFITLRDMGLGAEARMMIDISRREKV